jgi:hypothetical protein
VLDEVMSPVAGAVPQPRSTSCVETLEQPIVRGSGTMALSWTPDQRIVVEVFLTGVGRRPDNQRR